MAFVLLLLSQNTKWSQTKDCGLSSQKERIGGRILTMCLTHCTFGEKIPFPWTRWRGLACLRKAGFPGGGRCEDARGAGAGIGQRPQPIPARPAYNLQAGTYLPNLPSARQPAGSRFKVSGGGQDLEWRSSLELQLGLQSLVHTMNTARTPCVRAAQCPCVHTLFTTANKPKQ